MKTFFERTAVRAAAVLAALVFGLGGCPTPSDPAKSSDAALKSLELSAGVLSPAFAPETAAYTADVANGVESVTLTGTPNHEKAAVAGNGPHALSVGANPVALTVTAEDGTVGVYTVTLTRAEPAEPVTVTALDLGALIPVPLAGAAPVAALDGAQYTGTVAWLNADDTPFTGAVFVSGAVYRAAVTLTAKPGYTFTGIGANVFTHAGAASAPENPADSGTLSIRFPEVTATAETVTTLDLGALVIAPVIGAAPDTPAIDEDQYTGDITWRNDDDTPFTGVTFASGTVYRALVTLTAKAGYTFTGVETNRFTHSAGTASNAADSGTVSIRFPATDQTVSALNLGGLIAAPAVGTAPVKTLNEVQYTGTVAWETVRGSEFTGPAFVPGIAYRAVVTLAAKPGYTFTGLGANAFTYAGASSVTNPADSGAVTIVFSAIAGTPPFRAMIPVPGGTVADGTTPWGSSNKYPLPQTIPAFQIGATEVTYELWYEVYQWATDSARGTNVYTFVGPGREGNQTVDGPVPSDRKYEPVTYIHWRDAVVWCNAYSEKTAKTPVYYEDSSYTTVVRIAEPGSGSGSASAGNGKAEKAFLKADANGFRLPTEAEWEYAARGASTAAAAWSYTYAGSNTADDIAWNDDNSGNTTHEAATIGPNTLGIYDMSGNVREFCQDVFSSNTRVARGGYYSGRLGSGGSGGPSVEISTRSSYSLSYSSLLNYQGFRVAANNQ